MPRNTAGILRRLYVVRSGISGKATLILSKKGSWSRTKSHSPDDFVPATLPNLGEKKQAGL
jgi:hypothetical protein